MTDECHTFNSQCRTKLGCTIIPYFDSCYSKRVTGIWLNKPNNVYTKMDWDLKY